jgi:steroid 5-alpha reductase family enzyme
VAEPFLATLIAISLFMFAFWLASVALRDVSIVDIGWGLGFVVVTWVAHSAGDGGARSTLQAVLVTIWGVRLGGYLLWRNWGREEDYRYRAMRKRAGPAYTWLSIVTVFGLQGVLMYVVSLPVQVVQASAAQTLGIVDFIALAMFLIGFGFEAAGDVQLARFKADPSNDGNVMDRGVWAWTRHPNYFGDALQWWAFGLFALATPGAAWTLIGPALMTFLLLRVSGVRLRERGLRKRKQGYGDYSDRVPAFLPRPPRT